MPLLHKQKFIKKPLSTDLDPNQEIFYCKLTQEIFFDYDEYFERTILCNSLVWTCSLSGKSGLTYSEALQSEEKAKQSITSFPRILEKIVVYLALFTKRGNIKDLLDDIFAYIKDRYFIGETVSVVIGQQLNHTRGEIRKTCKIIDVIAPPPSAASAVDVEHDSTDNSEQFSENDDEDDGNKSKEHESVGPNADKYKYVIESQSVSGQSNRITVNAAQISRPKGLLTKDKVQIILKMSCEAVNNIWVVKDSAKEKYSINSMKFDQVFKGEPPKFDVSFGRGKYSKLKQLNSSSTKGGSPNGKSPHLNHSMSASSKGGKGGALKGASNGKAAMKRSLSTSAINHNNVNKLKNNSSKVLNSSASAKLSSKIKKKYSKQKTTIEDNSKRMVKSSKKLNISQEEDEEVLRKFAEKEVRRMEAQKLMDEGRTVLSMSEEEFALWHEFVTDEVLDELAEIELEYEKLRRKEEREKEKERLRVEKRTQKEHEKELKKPKEDLECEKLVEIPKAIPIQTKISTNLFGDALMIVEFLNSFGDLFDIHVDFPNGFNIEQLEEALYSKSCHSALCNLLLFYLDWIFKCYDEEYFEELNASSDEEASEIAVDSDDEEVLIDQLYHEPIRAANDDRDNFVKLAEKYSKLIRGSQGRGLKTIGLDVYTVSEMLRLYFLTSGSLHNHKIKFWSQQRGGYTHLDDIGIDFAIHETEIVKKLETMNVYELEPEEKLKILSSLCHQLITQVRFRDVVEDNFQKLTTLRAQLRDLQTEENRRLREEASDRWKKKLEEKAKQKTRLEEIKTNVVNKSPNAKESAKELQNEEYRLKKQADESAKRRDEFLKKERQLLDEIYEAQTKYSLAPLGKDRYHRRYWIYKSIPGLFVEDDDQYVEQLVDSIEIKHEMNDNCITNGNGHHHADHANTSHETNSSILSSTEKDHKLITSSVAAGTSTGEVAIVGKENNPNVANTSIFNCSNILSNSYFNTSDLKMSTTNFKKGEVKWSFYHKTEDIEKLINTLNERGYRESELKQNLAEFKSRIYERLHKCPFKHLAMTEEDLEKHTKSIETVNNLKRREFYLSLVNNQQSVSHLKINSPVALAHDYLESDFRDKLLDIEEQIYNGSLGNLKVSDRLKWKNAIEKGHYDAQCTSLTWADLIVTVKTAGQHEQSSLSEIIGDLSKALLQIEQAVERRFLRTPLSDVQKTPDKTQTKKPGKKSKTNANDDEDTQSSSNNEPNRWQTIWNWEKSLMNCTSLSQLFLHLQSLDESIAWSKSAMNARCRLCRKKGDADKMLLCDKCDRGHHIYCLRPRLKVIPEGEWFCPECKPKDVEKTPRKMRKAFEVEEDHEIYSNGSDVEMKDDYSNNNNNNSNHHNGAMSDEDVNVDDSYDDRDNKQRKARKRKLAADKSDNSDIVVAPAKTRGRPKKIVVENPATSNDNSNQSANSKNKSKQQNGHHDEYQSEEELNGYEPKNSTKKRTSRNGMKSPFDFHLNNTSSRNSELTHRLKITEKLVADLIKHSDAWPFLKPVTKREAPDYFEVIKHPMDFASIKNNINHFKYTDYTNILDDIRLVFANCRTYNEPSSDIYKTGQRLSNFFEAQVKKLNLV